MTPEQLKQIAPTAQRSKCAIYAPILTKLMPENGIDTYLRICHFLAQILHESGALNYVEEIASGAAYEGRKDLGNVKKGDGVRFKGRGLIQITGRSNYTQLAKDLGIDCVNYPELLELPENAVRSAIWFWNLRNLNKYADADDIFTITRKINGGTNGFDDRKKYLVKSKYTLK